MDSNIDPDELRHELTALQYNVVGLRMNGMQALMCLNGLLAMEAESLGSANVEMLELGRHMQRVIFAAIEPGPAVTALIAHNRAHLGLSKETYAPAPEPERPRIIFPNA